MHFSCQKTDWGAKGAPVSPSPVWTHFGSNFRDFSDILCKNMCSLNVLVFVLQFWVALSIPREGMICNPYAPVQSEHTFCFSYLFLKKGSQRVQHGAIWGSFLDKNGTLV